MFRYCVGVILLSSIGDMPQSRKFATELTGSNQPDTRPRFQVSLNGRGLARSGEFGDKDVVSFFLHLQTKAYGSNGSVLPEVVIVRCKIISLLSPSSSPKLVTHDCIYINRG